MRDPNLFIIGAAKCGTTSMYNWLRNHPDVFMSPVKEPLYYCTDFEWRNVKDKEVYDSLFKGANYKHKAVGEASASYYLSDVAIPKIEEKYDEPKYIYMVREQKKIALSLHKELLKTGNEHIDDFEKAWRLSEERRKGKFIGSYCRNKKWLDYKNASLVGERLKWVLQKVPKKRVKVVFLEDIKKEALEEYKKVLNFVGANYDGRDEFPVSNKRAKNKYRIVQKAVRTLGDFSRKIKDNVGINRKLGTGILNYIQRMNKSDMSREGISSELESEMTDYYEEDKRLLHSLTNKTAKI